MGDNKCDYNDRDKFNCCEKECLNNCKDKCFQECYCDNKGSSCGLIILLILVIYFCCNGNDNGKGPFGIF